MYDETDDVPAPTLSFPKAVLLSLLGPGTSLIAVGHLLAGLVINLLFVVAVVLFVVAVSVWKFFPLYPLAVLSASWVLLAFFAILNSREIVQQGEARFGRAYQHPLLFVLIAVLTFLAPLAMTSHFTSRFLFSFADVSTLAMYPQARPGDRVMIDRTVFRSTSPQRGDLVAVRLPQTGELAILRVVAVPTDKVQMQGYTLLINDDFMDYSPLDPSWIRVGLLEEELEILIEHNHDQSYVVAIKPGVDLDIGISGMELPEDHYFLLADNRSILAGDEKPLQVDSRVIGPVTRDYIEGSPLFIAWSQHPQTGSLRWDRIGLTTD